MRPSGSPPSAAPEGAFAPAIIVLLTDGASNTGPEPVAAAQQAVDRGIRVYTIGFGTQDAGSRPPFRQLPTDLITSHEVVEISVVFTAIAVLICLAILLGQTWRPLP